MKYNIFTYTTLKVLLFSTLFTACTEDNISITETQTAIVEAYLYAGQPLDSFKITQSFSYFSSDTNLITLDELEVRIENEDETVSLFNIGGGIYQNLDFTPQSGQSYTMYFEHNNEAVEATTYLPEKRMIQISQATIQLEKISSFPPTGGMTEVEPVEVSWDNSEGDYYYVVVENIEEDPEFVNDFLAQFQTDGRPVRLARITEPGVTDFHLLDARRDLTQFGTYQIIVFRVNPEYAALYESSGTSSVNITQPPSNIENGLGIFTGVSSDTIYLEVEKI